MYSRLYIERTRREQDSKRARTRLSAWYETCAMERCGTALAMTIKMTLGCYVPTYARGNMNEEFFTRDRTEIRDVLDTVTLLYDVLRQGSHGSFLTSGLILFVKFSMMSISIIG